MVLAAGLAAQQPGVHPVSGRRFAPVMGYQGAPWLERSEREEEEAPDVALNVLKIPKGASVADIGAGSGYITVRLAARVGAIRARVRQRRPAADAQHPGAASRTTPRSPT